MKPVIVLLDIDGVLIRPGGYRQAVQNSLRYLYDRMGLDTPVPPLAIGSIFESQRVTTEWDMVPITLGMILSAIGEQVGGLPAKSLPEMIGWVREKRVQGIRLDYEALVASLGRYAEIGTLPSEGVLEAIQSGRAAPLFPHFDHQPFVQDLFGDTRDLKHCLTTQLVQNFVLGHDAYEKTYGLAALVPSSSMLMEHDRPAVEVEMVQRVLELMREGKLHPCAYTARCSLAPKTSGADPRGFSPEAEMALSLVGLQDIPVIGYGSVTWLGMQVGEHQDYLLKPAPIQALAACATAWTGREPESLMWGYQVGTGRPVLLENKIELPAEFELHVIEDSATGIEAVQGAVRLLRERGHDVDLHAWGISTHPAKKAALQATGATIFDDTTQAMREAFKNLL